MKLVTYRKSGRTSLGVVDPEGATVAPVNGPGHHEPGDVLRRLITSHEPGDPVALSRSDEVLALSEVTLLAPVPQLNRNIFCVGKNYHEHAREFAHSGVDVSSKAVLPERPIFFTKPPTSIIGPGEPITPHQGVTSAIDYEAELAVVIGRQGTGIAEADVWDHIWGYTIVNDITARDLQRDHKQWFLGKSLDTFCPMGPWLVTADEIDPLNLTVECWVNGESRQHANTRDLIFGIPELVATLSAGMTLYPGDILATGTPAGVGIGFDPPRFLRSGDEVSVRITGLGTLTNSVAPVDAPSPA